MPGKEAAKMDLWYYNTTMGKNRVSMYVCMYVDSRQRDRETRERPVLALAFCMELP